MRRIRLAFLHACAFPVHAENAASVTGPLLRLTAPEGDASIVVVDLASATDADGAMTQAWKLAQPEFRRTLRLATPRASRNGWVDQKAFEDETTRSAKV